jgi:DNA-binding NarL/FixJ family response regulator
MPVMEGLDAVAHLKREFPEMKIIIVTSDDIEQLKDRCIAIGSDAVLPKLTRQEELCELVGKLIGPCGLPPHE